MSEVPLYTLPVQDVVGGELLAGLVRIEFPLNPRIYLCEATVLCVKKYARLCVRR